MNQPRTLKIKLRADTNEVVAKDVPTSWVRAGAGWTNRATFGKLDPTVRYIARASAKNVDFAACQAGSIDIPATA